MTVSTQQSEVTCIGNGATTVFSFPFIGVSASDIEVTYTDTQGNQTILTGTQYTLSLNAPATGALWGIGGTVTYPISGSAIAANTQLTIKRIVSLTQDTSISNQGSFYPEAVEEALDTLCLELQQVANRTGKFRGTWATNIFYNYGDIVVDGSNGANTGNYYMCISTNTSGTWSTDLSNGDWTVFINIQVIAGYATSAASSATAAANSASSAAASSSSASGYATSASNSASAAATSATNSANSATDAANSAATASADAALIVGNIAGYNTFSYSSQTIGTGYKTFTVDSGKSFTANQWVTAVYQVGLPYYMHGIVVSYSGTTMVINVTDTGGSGTFSAWNITTSGPLNLSPLITKTANYTVTATDKYIEADASGGAITITVAPTIGTSSLTATVIIEKIDTSSNPISISDGTNIVDVIVTAASSSGQINGWRSITANGTNIRSYGVG